MPNASRRTNLRTSVAVGVAFGAGLLAARMVANTYRFTVERIRSDLPGLERDVRVVLLFYLHY